MDLEYLTEQEIKPGIIALEVRTTTRVSDISDNTNTQIVLVTPDGVGPTLFDDGDGCDIKWSEDTELLIAEAESLVDPPTALDASN